MLIPEVGKFLFSSSLVITCHGSKMRRSDLRCKVTNKCPIVRVQPKVLERNKDNPLLSHLSCVLSVSVK